MSTTEALPPAPSAPRTLPGPSAGAAVGTLVFHGAYFLQVTSFLDALGSKPWSVRPFGRTAAKG